MMQEWPNRRNHGSTNVRKLQRVNRGSGLSPRRAAITPLLVLQQPTKQKVIQATVIQHDRLHSTPLAWPGVHPFSLEAAFNCKVGSLHAMIHVQSSWYECLHSRDFQVLPQISLPHNDVSAPCARLNNDRASQPSPGSSFSRFQQVPSTDYVESEVRSEHRNTVRQRPRLPPDTPLTLTPPCMQETTSPGRFAVHLALALHCVIARAGLEICEHLKKTSHGAVIYIKDSFRDKACMALALAIFCCRMCIIVLKSCEYQVHKQHDTIIFELHVSQSSSYYVFDRLIGVCVYSRTSICLTHSACGYIPRQDRYS